MVPRTTVTSTTSSRLGRLRLSPSVGPLFVVANAEFRSLRRLSRTWVYWTAVATVGATLYVYHSLAYFANSVYSATYAAIDPRFLASTLGTFALWTAQAGLVFLAADVIDHDRRERLDDVLGAKTLTNVELLAGRLIALVVIAWLPLGVVAASFQIGAAFAALLGWPLSGPMEPMSLCAFLLVDSLPTLILWGSITVFLAVALRSRVAAVVSALLALGLQAWCMLHSPLYLLPVVSGTTGFANIASDLLPRFAEWPAIVQRSSLVMIAAGVVMCAAAIHRRCDPATPLLRIARGSTLVAAGLAGIAGLFVHASQRIEERDGWRAAHAAERERPRWDLERIAGRVEVMPGERLELDVDVVLRSPASAGPAALVLSFNPGMRIQDLKLDGVDVSHQHAAGLLRVEPGGPYSQGSRVVLSLAATGVPDPLFGYLDAAVDPMRRSVVNSQLHVLGTEVSIFERDYVALMPGGHWLPAPGAVFPSSGPARPRDFFEIDIEVGVPRGWLAAGPGRRADAGGDDKSARFRFRPDTLVSSVGILAAGFERRVLDVAGVDFEILLHPGHLPNVDALGGAAMAPILRTLVPPTEFGLAYPDAALSLVETPGRLRTYGGGWRMDTLQALPGILLLREYGFPTARLERAIGELREDEYGLLLLLARYFSHDFSGGNLLNASRNLLAFQTGTIGQGAVELDFLIEELSDRVMGLYNFRGGVDRFFSAHLFALGHPSGAGTGMFAAATGNTAWIDGAARRETERIGLWDDAVNTPLTVLDAHRTPRDALGLLTLKARARASLIVDLLGREGTAELLGELRRRHAGGHFGGADIDAAAADIRGSTGSIVGDWLDETSLPGFVASDVEVYRLADDDEGRPRYQVSLHIHNGEPTPGWLRVFCDMGHYDRDYAGLSDPVRVEGRESVSFGLLSLGPPRGIAVIPYLSKNRGAVYLPLPQFDEEESVDRDPRVGVGASRWRPRRDRGIVVDDLDAGFGIEGDGATADWRSWLTIERGQWADFDHGLPVIRNGEPREGEWYREETRWGWGKYRRTIARTLPGVGEREAVFTVHLPSGGRWRLDYHMPGRTVRGSSGAGKYDDQGRYDMRVEADGAETAIEFDASVAELGWNHLGDFPLGPGDVRVVVRNRTSGRSVIADAIRWRPVGVPPSSSAVTQGTYASDGEDS